MNFLDISLIIINVIILLVCLMFIIYNFVTDSIRTGFISIISSIFVIAFASIFTVSPFVVLDRGSGSTIGIITSVDKNFFGTTALYIKTSESEQEKYCIENNDISNLAKELIGIKVKISYGERIGFYSTGTCHQAPVESIEVQE